MDLSLRVSAALIGLLLILSFLRSALQVAVVNRQRGDWVTRRVAQSVYSTVARLAVRRQSYADVQDVLAWVLPVYMLLVIIVWFCMLGAGFSLLIWSRQAEHSFLQAVIASGSALSTLGFLTPPDVAGRLLAIVEGAMGLGVVVFYFTFIPGYQTTIQQRESKIAWLYARAIPDLTNFTLVEWFALSGAADWNNLWEEWESWFRNLCETRALAILAFVPSIHRGQTWLFAAAVALDSVSFYLSTLEVRAMSSAGACHRTGVDALRLIAAELSDCHNAPKPIGERRLARADFDAMYDRLTTLGVKVKPERETCWLRFVELRKEYETILPKLAECLVVPVHERLLLPLVAPAPATPADAFASGNSDP